TFGDPPVPLSEAVRAERRILEPLASRASVFLDTSDINTHDLQRLLSIRLADSNRLHVLFESFGFKNGVPLDADFVFDVRSLPNPHWVPHLRPLTGKDDEIAQFFRGNELVEMMFDDVYRFLSSWLPRLAAEHRHYLTIAIGCTGGQHRSVYMVERLAARMAENNLVIQTLHRELAKSHD
ncbi:MAG TPA: RNase adapter RapZ, partial [Terriglobales bacterium]|nr:RNase adapter RapZ [Terriglobales bacterium]